MADGSAQTRGAFWAATIRDKLGYSWAYFAIPGPEFVHKSSLVSLLLLSAEGSCKGQVQRAGAKGSALKGAAFWAWYDNGQVGREGEGGSL